MKQIRYEGKIYKFSDDFTDDEISDALAEEDALKEKSNQNLTTGSFPEEAIKGAINSGKDYVSSRKEDPKKIIGDVATVAPFIYSPQGAIPAQIAKMGAAAAGSALIKDLSEGEDIKASAKDAAIEGGLAGLFQGALSKPVFKAGAKYGGKAYKNLASLMSGIEKSDFDKVIENPGIFNINPSMTFENEAKKGVEKYGKLKGEKEAFISGEKSREADFKNQINEAKAKYKNDLQEFDSNKVNEREIAANKLIELFNSKKKELGENVWNQRSKITDSGEIDTSVLVSEIDNALNSNIIESGGKKRSSLSPAEISKLKSIRDQLINIEKKNPVGSLSDEKQNVPKLSDLQADKVLSEIDRSVKYFSGEKGLAQKTDAGDAILKKVRNKLSEQLGEKLPEFQAAKNEFSKLMDLKGLADLGKGKFGPINSKIQRYEKLPYEFQKNLSSLADYLSPSDSPLNFKFKDAPELDLPTFEKRELPQELIEKLTRYRSFNELKPATNLVKNLEKEPLQNQADIAEFLGPESINEVEKANLSDKFSKIKPDFGRVGTTAAGAYGLSHISPTLAAIASLMAPLSSPAVNKYAIKGAHSIGNMGKKAADIAPLMEMIKRSPYAISQFINPDGSNTQKSIDELRKERGIR